MSITLTERPFSDSFLFAYSKEHIVYELDMFFWLSNIFGTGTQLKASTKEDAQRLSFILIESFVIHLRNLIDFLYIVNPQKKTDIVAEDFFEAGEWKILLPPISEQLKTARIRANKELAHLTTDRKTGIPPEKGWNFPALVCEIRPLIQMFADKAKRSRLSPQVSQVIHN